MPRSSRFHSDRDEIVPLKSWPYVPIALYQRFRMPPPRPWFNHRALRLLIEIITPETRVLEVGAGDSTRWYGERAGVVDSIEGKSDWFERVWSKTEDQANVHVRFVPEPDMLDALRAIHGGYDLVVLDTLDAEGRVEASRVIRDRHPDAIIVIDDQDWEGHREIDAIFEDWTVLRLAGMKSRPFAVFETNFFALDRSKLTRYT